MDLDLFPPTLPVFATVSRYEDGPRWLASLPQVVKELSERWSLRLGEPFHGGSCSWVAPVLLPGGGTAVLKVTWPHREALGEAEALRLWAGRGTVLLHQADRSHLAVLVERCEPGVTLAESRALSPDRRLLIGAQLLHELWSVPPPDPAQTDLEQLAGITAAWADLVEERMARFAPDFNPGLVSLGARLLRELPRDAGREAIVHGDFNPGNILSARRKPWLVIDAKPMIGDPGYDVWPLVSQIDDPFAHPDPQRVLAARMTLVADMVGEDPARLAAWATAREVEAALWSVAHPGAPVPSGAVPSGAVPSGAVTSGAVPSGAVPSVAVTIGSMDKARAFARLAGL